MVAAVVAAVVAMCVSMGPACANVTMCDDVQPRPSPSCVGSVKPTRSLMFEPPLFCRPVKPGTQCMLLLLFNQSTHCTKHTHIVTINGVLQYVLLPLVTWCRPAFSRCLQAPGCCISCGERRAAAALGVGVQALNTSRCCQPRKRRAVCLGRFGALLHRLHDVVHLPSLNHPARAGFGCMVLVASTSSFCCLFLCVYVLLFKLLVLVCSAGGLCWGAEQAQPARPAWWLINRTVGSGCTGL